MSRRRGGKQLRVLLFECALFLLLSLNLTNADGSVGCLYTSSLCDSKTEWCYDDLAFGRCIFKYGFVPEDLYRFKFKYEDLDNLRQILEQLRLLDFTWKHLYTQCVVQMQLYSVRTGIQYDGESCDKVLKQETTDPIRLLQYEQGLAREPSVSRNQPAASNEGIIKYGPDDEFNSVTRQQNGQNTRYEQKPDYESELLNQLRIQSTKLKPEVYKKNFKSTSSRYRGTPLYVPLHNRDKFKLSENEFSINKEPVEGKISEADWPREKDVYEELMTLRKEFDTNADENAKAYSEGGAMSIGKKTEFENNVYDKILDQYGEKMLAFQRSERLDVKKPGPYYKVNNYAFGNVNTQDKEAKENENEEKNNSNGYKRRVLKDVFSETYPNYQSPSYEYVPGNYRASSHVNRIMPVEENPSYVTIETNNELSESTVSQLVGKLTKLFHFPPGIFSNRRFHGNKLIFKIKQNILNPSAAEIKRLIDESNAVDMTEGIRITNTYLGKPKDESAPTNSPEIEDPDQYSVVDVDYAYIQLKDPIRNKAEGEKIVDGIEKILLLPEDTLYEVNTAVSEILFKIKPNTQNLNASELARRIDLMKNQIKHELKIEITSVGIGDKDKLPTATRLSNTDDNLYMLTFIVCGVIGAVLVSAVALYCTKRQSRLKDKLHKIIPSDKEFSKDYQDLCRARMARKSSQEATSSGGQRITSLSRESDNSPSSRSSTSSWSEEPMTNMDITTGHMVLAYMEDHLNNKARLDTEWAALCTYDADPCSVAIAQLQENIRKNRYVNALPYDHARVILNALSNVNGSDYINASTITDHDPRNAAYIATQGPLENTVCDFWQMIWEQGCVVIVMLTRLVENDTSMCHRYWPLEGADVYNIYEVHLVSEHIWCDDFLVRSFYLKNLKTTETRTVTQFHFLTWPEGGIPTATKPLLEFRRKVNKSFRGRSCPIVVHCSDGVGRTGSYLLIDMVLNRISKGAKEIDIAATLEHIRDQRAGAVCTKQQFQFVLSAVAEEVQAALRALPQQQSTAQDQGVENSTSGIQPEATAASSEDVKTEKSCEEGQPSSTKLAK